MGALRILTRYSIIGLSFILLILRFKGIVSWDEYFLKVLIINRYCLYVHVLIVFTIFWLFDKKNQPPSYSLLFWNYWLILKIIPLTRIKDPKAYLYYLKKDGLYSVHPIQQAPESPILYHFFNKGKALTLCL